MSINSAFLVAAVALAWITLVIGLPVELTPDGALYLSRAHALLRGDGTALLHRPMMTLVSLGLLAPVPYPVHATLVAVGLCLLYAIIRMWQSIVAPAVMSTALLVFFLFPLARTWAPKLLPDLLSLGLALMAAGIFSLAPKTQQLSQLRRVGLILGLACLVKESNLFFAAWPLPAALLLLPRRQAWVGLIQLYATLGLTLLPWLVYRLLVSAEAGLWSQHLIPLLTPSTWPFIMANAPINLSRFASSHAGYWLALPLLWFLVPLFRRPQPHQRVLLLLWLNWLPVGCLTILLGWRSGQYFILVLIPLLLITERMHRLLPQQQQRLFAHGLSLTALTLSFWLLTMGSPFTLTGLIGPQAQAAALFIETTGSDAVFASEAGSRMLAVHAPSGLVARRLPTVPAPELCRGYAFGPFASSTLSLASPQPRFLCFEQSHRTALVLVLTQAEPNLYRLLDSHPLLYQRAQFDTYSVFAFKSAHDVSSLQQ